MIQVEPCKGCGRALYTGKVANLDVRCEVEPIDAQTVIPALLAGRELWKAGPNGLTPAGPAVLRCLNDSVPPTVVGSHVCKALNGRLPASQKVGGPTPPKALPESPVAPQNRFSGPSAGLSGVLVAVNPGSDPETDLPVTARRPTCDACEELCSPGTYTGVMLGGTWIHVWHTDCQP